MLLQILDDGRLTDSQGRLVDFRNTVIIMTSNIGSQIIVDAGAAGGRRGAGAGWSSGCATSCGNHFRPEFLNRVDDIIVFRPLSREDLVPIVDIQLRQLEDTLAQRHLRLEVTPEARELLADAGVRSGVRRPSAQAGHPARAAEPDRARAAGGQLPRGRH